MFQDGQRVALHREVPSSAAIYTRPPVGDQRPSTAATIRMVQPPVQPPEPKTLEGHGDWQCPRTSPGLLSALPDHSTERKAIADLLGGAPSPYGGPMAQHTLLCVLNPHHQSRQLHNKASGPGTQSATIKPLRLHPHPRGWGLSSQPGAGPRALG